MARTTTSTATRSQRALKEDPQEASRRVIWQAHPRYIEWHDVWRNLGYVYEGDGPYLDGSALIAHPRELLYERDAANQINFERPVRELPKFQRRRNLARYENFAQVIVDTISDHQYAKGPTRQMPAPPGYDVHPYLEWLDDVDGFGTSMTDWLAIHQAMASVYGKLWVVMDRMQEDMLPAREALIKAQRGENARRQVVTAADQGRPVLRAYTPLDAPDWLAPRNNLTSLKTVEAVERTSLMDPSNLYTNLLAARDLQPQDMPDVEFRIWTQNRWEVYDKDGTIKDQGVHGMGRCPVAELYARRRIRIPLVGRSLLKDPKLFQDHYNLLSELRELLRNQTFSILHVMLGEKEEVAEARGRLGTHASTENVAFSKGGMEYIAPPDGPAATIMKEIENVERKIYRLTGLPWEADSRDAESADSRRLKAADLDRTLAKQADEAEKFEYDVHRLWFYAHFGAQAGEVLFRRSGYVCKHPDEFNVQEVMATIEETRETLTLGMGPTANAKVRKQALPILIKNLGEEDKAAIEKEIDEASQFEEENKRAMDVLTTQSLMAPPAGEEGGSGGEGGGGPKAEEK